jgi:hypothetical protein
VERFFEERRASWRVSSRREPLRRDNVFVERTSPWRESLQFKLTLPPWPCHNVSLSWLELAGIAIRFTSGERLLKLSQPWFGDISEVDMAPGLT